MRHLPMRHLPMRLLPVRLIRKMSSARAFIPWLAPTAAALLAVAVASAPAARAQGGAEGVFAVTYLDVSPTALGQGVDLLKKYRDAGKREASNLEFTVLQ